MSSPKAMLLSASQQLTLPATTITALYILKAYALMSCLMSLSLIQMQICLKQLFKQVK